MAYDFNRLDVETVQDAEGEKKQVSFQHLIAMAQKKAKILVEEEAKRFENYGTKVSTEFEEVTKKKMEKKAIEPESKQ